jgi:lipopolysaccharide transport system permease protein
MITVSQNDTDIKSARQEPLIVIQSGRANAHYLRDVWRLKRLLAIFSWRDIVLKYRQTTAGVLWVALRPLLTMAVFAVVFGRFLKIPSGDIPYPLLILSGLIPWQFVAFSFAGASESLFNYGGVLSKVYFPRILVPLSTLAVNLVDLLVSLLLLVPFMVYYGVVPDWRVWTLPLFVLGAFPAAAGLGLWFSAVSAKYRDFRNVVPFVVLLSLYVSPVAFTAAIVPESWKAWYWLNPLVGLIEGFRWALFGGNATLFWPGVLASQVLSVAILVTGYFYFRRLERAIVDIL